MENLGQIANNADSARLADKAKKVDPFLGKAVIGSPDNVIPIPEGTSVIRTKSGEVRFYRFNPDVSNGYIPVPEGVAQIQFQNYKGNPRYIDYGEPIFY